MIQFNLLFYFLFTACIPARYILSILGSIAMAIIYGLKVNLSVAMVAMVNHTAVSIQNTHAAVSTLDLNATAEVREECEADFNNSTAPPVVN